MTHQILVGDVGGTNVRFGLASIENGLLRVDDFAILTGDDFNAFDDALSMYVADKRLDTSQLSAVFALAGPPNERTVKLTNRNWTISADALEKQFKLTQVLLANDFTAMARSVPELDPNELVSIKPGTPQTDAPIIIAGPGTGFGVATLLQDSTCNWKVVSGEGGHMAYAPQTDIEFELTKLLLAEFGYVSTELVCAGVGLSPVHKALCKIFARTFEETPPGKMLELAAAGDEMFQELCLLRARGTMRAVGDLVLANGALGGAILAGGVSSRLIDYLKSQDALSSFGQRGREMPFLERCPVHLLENPVAPLIGAAALCLKDSSVDVRTNLRETAQPRP